jgi:hypothetical protein
MEPLLFTSYLLAGLSQVSLPYQLLSEQKTVYPSVVELTPCLSVIPPNLLILTRPSATLGETKSSFSQISRPLNEEIGGAMFKSFSLLSSKPSGVRPGFLDVFPPPLGEVIEEQCRDVPTGLGIPAFQPGIEKKDVIRMLGVPTGTSGGYWPNTRAVFYELIPERVSLGFLFDRHSERIRQTEASFTGGVDTKIVLLTLNGMLGCKLNEQIQQGLQKVQQGESQQYSFKLDTLKGLIERQEGDRLYIGIWEADLH